MQTRGFTFLELLIVLGLVAMLAVLAVPAYQGFQSRQQLDSTANELLQTLRLAQTKASAGIGNAAAGVHLEADRFTLFSGSSYVAQPDDFVILLPPSVRISSWSLVGSGSDVVFDQLRGTSANAGTITVTATSLGESVTIVVAPVGLVEVE